jgi:hypothetical protein
VNGPVEDRRELSIEFRNSTHLVLA